MGMQGGGGMVGGGRGAAELEFRCGIRGIPQISRWEINKKPQIHGDLRWN